MKSTISLDPRIFDSGNFRTPPVAPPRKRRSTLKKGSTLPTSFESIPNGGFKDVFTNGGASRVLTYDDIEYIDRDENVRQTRADIEQDEARDRKLKVGNKKTDKFFGESLSDHLSDEPIVSEEASQTAEGVNTSDETDRSSTSDKKLFFLLNMLDQEHADEEKYKDKEPVEEPLFVAKKKEVKPHICDDDDHMHTHFHSHEKHEKESEHAVAPPKPDRDFSKYQNEAADAGTGVEDQIISAVSTKVSAEDREMQAKIEAIQKNVDERLTRVKKSISREDLPAPPATPKRKSGVMTGPETPTIRIETIDFPTSSADDNEARKEVTQVKRPPNLNLTNYDSDDHEIKHDVSPSTPKMVTNAADQMFKKAYGLHDFHPEDHDHHHDDGSNLAAPTSKLTTRKVSVSRKNSTEDTQTPCLKNNTESGSSLRKLSTESAPSVCSDSGSSRLMTPTTPRKKTSFCEDPLKAITESLQRRGESPMSPPKSPQPEKREYEKMLGDPSMNDIIEEIYSKNSIIMQEFQTYLEKSIESKPVINVDQEKKFLQEKGITGNEYSRTPEPLKKLHELDDDLDDAQVYSDSFESTDTEQETVHEIEKLAAKMPKYNSRRRESIEDVDTWFRNHTASEQSESDINGPLDSIPTPPSTYDRQKTFPFGRTIYARRGSTSDEFFAESPQPSVRSHIEVLRESESSISENDEPIRSKEKSPDHSTLLKYFDKDAKTN